MKIKDLIEQLKYGELSLHKLFEYENKNAETNLKRKEGLINAAVLEMYKRFDFKTRSTTVEVIEGTNCYQIIDKGLTCLDEDFERDIIEILQVIDKHGIDAILNNTRKYNYEQKVNEHTAYFGLMIDTPNHNVISVPKEYKGELTVIYKPLPETITGACDITDKASYDAYLDKELDVPVMYMQAMVYFIASRLMLTLKGKDGAVAPYTDLYKRFEEECMRLQQYGYDVNGLGSPEQRFEIKGFV